MTDGEDARNKWEAGRSWSGGETDRFYYNTLWIVVSDGPGFFDAEAGLSVVYEWSSD